jgi:hypothetical protein
MANNSEEGQDPQRGVVPMLMMMMMMMMILHLVGLKNAHIHIHIFFFKEKNSHQVKYVSISGNIIVM